MANLVVPPNELASHVGQVVGTSDWFEITQERINAFADATDDWQFIHVDQEKAAASPLGSTIAHGFLTLALLTPLAGGVSIMPEGMQVSLNYGLDKVRFLAPVPAGASVRAVVQLKDVDEKQPGHFRITSGITMEIRDQETPALIADWIFMVITDDEEE